MTKWKTEDQGNQYNTAVVASGQENITFQDSLYKKGFNYLSVTNRDVTDVEIRLNGEQDGGRVEWCPAGVTITIEPDEGRFFDFITVVNLDAGKDETANKILYRASRMVEVPQAVRLIK